MTKEPCDWTVSGLDGGLRGGKKKKAGNFVGLRSRRAVRRAPGERLGACLARRALLFFLSFLSISTFFHTLCSFLSPYFIPIQ